MENLEFQILHQKITNSKPALSNYVLYENGVKSLGLCLTENDLEIQKFLIHHPNWFAVINCGLQLLLKKSVLKKRFLLGISIIECDKNYIHLFLNLEKQKLSYFKLVFHANQSIMNAIIAFFLFKFKKWI
jgi:hypothetical protein